MLIHSGVKYFQCHKLQIPKQLKLFASYEFPEQTVSDNGPQFVSEEFHQFMSRNGIRHIRRAPYHPESNGLVGRFVYTFKEAMNAGKNDELTCQIQNHSTCYYSTSTMPTLPGTFSSNSF